MLKKYIICFLILSIINFTGCSYSEIMSKNDVDNGKCQLDFNEELFCTTKDYTKYHFAPGNYHIAKDSLYGKGVIESSSSITPFKGSIALTEIVSFEQNKSDAVGTIGLVAGIVVVGVLVYGLILSAIISDEINPD